MSEKQTSTIEPTPPEERRIISDEDYAMLKDWEAQTAASRRTVSFEGLAPITPIEAAPSRAEREQARAAAHPATAGESAPRLTRRQRQMRTLKWTAAGAGLAVGIAGLASLEGGNDNSERGESTAAIASITANPDANFRLDPVVDDDVTGPNTALHLGAEVTIDTAHDIRILEGTNNGTWYGIQIDDIEKAVPDAADIHDKDGILWLNEQGVESIQQKEDTPVAEK